MAEMLSLARAAREASIPLAASRAEVRNAALLAIAHALEAQADVIIQSNERDMARAQEENLSAPLLKRLRVDEKKIASMAAGARALAGLEDPIGATQLARELAPGLELYRVSCPIGVIGVIFESRPDATRKLECAPPPGEPPTAWSPWRLPLWKGSTRRD